MADEVSGKPPAEVTTPTQDKQVAGAGKPSPTAKAEEAVSKLPQAPADKSSPAVDVRIPASKADIGVGVPANLPVAPSVPERGSIEHKRAELEKRKAAGKRQPELSAKAAEAPSATRSRRRLTKEDLEGMSKPEIAAVAHDRGYQKIGFGRSSMITNFLEAQKDDTTLEKA